MKRCFTVLALVTFGMFVALASVEVLCRIIEKFSVTKPEWSDRPKVYFQPEGALTMQDYPFTREKPANTFRIAVVGDSFTFAPFMQFFDSFPKKLEQMLNLNLGTMRAQVYNYGAPALSTTHELYLIDQALEDQADLVIMQVTLNDAEVKQHVPVGIIGSSKFQPYGFDGALGWVLRHWHSLNFVLERIHNQASRDDYVEYFRDLWGNWKTYGQFKGAWEIIAKKRAKSGTKFVAIVFPLFGMPLDDKYPFYDIHKQIDGLLSSLDIPHLDISPIYRGIPLERLQVIPGVDRHPNEIAHRMAAERIYDWLLMSGLIPNELQIKRLFPSRSRVIFEEPLEQHAIVYPPERDPLFSDSTQPPK